MKNRKLSIILVLVVGLLPMLYNACAAQYNSAVDFKVMGSTGGNPFTIQMASVPFTPETTNFGLKLCIKKISVEGDTDVIDIWSGDPTLFDVSPNGTLFPDLNLPFPLAGKVTLLTSNACGGATPDIAVLNDTGTYTFTSDVGIKIHFAMTTPASRDTSWGLDFSPFMNGLAAITDHLQIRALFTSVEGVCQN